MCQCLLNTSGKLQIARGNNSNVEASVTGNINIGDNSWHHCAVVLNGNSVKTYIDGVSDLNTSTSVALGNDSAFFIGNQEAGTNGLSGSIDQLRIFNTVLPQSAVTALYNETTTTAQSASVDYVDANPNSVAYYKMSDATDQLGNYNGTPTSVNFNTEGKFGFAGSFNGSSSKIDISGVLNGITNSFSYSFWGNPSTASSNNYIAIAANISSSTNRILFNANNGGSFYFDFGNISSGGRIFGTSPSSWFDGNWHHFVIIKTPTSQLIFVDGQEFRNVSGQTSSVSGLSNLTIGNYTSNYSKGKIDQVRIYDSALSAANVTTLYNEIECPAVAVTNAFNTVLYTGNGGTQSITSLNFAPDLVWLKSRNYANNHFLYDSVRGTTKAIYIQAEPEITRSGVTSFDNNGFTLGSSTDMNESSKTYVAWNWKAPLANLSTSFNGSSSKIINNSLDTASTKAISLWANVNDFNERWAFQQGDGQGVENYIRFYNTDDIQVRIGNVTQTFSGYSANTWYHIVAQTNASGNANVWIDGVEVGTSTAPSQLTVDNTTIGARYNGGAYQYYFNGKIDQVRIYDSALSASEVSDLYAEPAASNNTLNYPAGAGCIAAYPLQTDAVDLSGNYNGTPSNVTFGKPGYLTQNTEGTITSTVAANVDAGFSIVQYTAGGAANVGHGLDSAPELIITKNIDTSEQWFVYSAAAGLQKFLGLNTNSAVTSNSGTYTSVTNTTFTNNISSTSRTYINYCFVSIPGYSRVGSYIGNGSTTGPVVYVGFEPSWLLRKNATSSTDAHWSILDNKRNVTTPMNPRFERLLANLSNAENTTDVNHKCDFNSTSFQPLSNHNITNASGQTYIYLAIA